MFFFIDFLFIILKACRDVTAREAYMINYNYTQKEGVKKNNIT